MSYLWVNGQPIDVLEEEPGIPLAFTWAGQTHQITAVANTWIIDDGWWQERVWRRYFKVQTKSGLLVIIYCDLLSHAWYLQRLYD
jgi:hypothetical protein